MAAVSSAKSAAQDTSSRAGPNGDGRTGSVPELSKEEELVAYRDMLAIRRFEEGTPSSRALSSATDGITWLKMKESTASAPLPARSSTSRT